ncbi:hypothetical protein MOMUL_02630 [Moorella mulderi DSM 14980]|uniref:Uncharacterized protein n=1 Tax=Moorella mulderi DSM 14980 TaxID=1122241 RepID=A0A151B1M5_9FIRM|nr:hypothetical protein [Moorella mulderi]KYH33557.1 hypothetical protein MOMUL_02630 [Moorella mulderi DSM 14980]
MTVAARYNQFLFQLSPEVIDELPGGAAGCAVLVEGPLQGAAAQLGWFYLQAGFAGQLAYNGQVLLLVRAGEDDGKGEALRQRELLLVKVM